MYTPIKGSWERINPLEVKVDPNITKNLEKFAKWWEKMPEDRKEKFTEIFTKGYNEEN